MVIKSMVRVTVPNQRQRGTDRDGELGLVAVAAVALPSGHKHARNWKVEDYLLWGMTRLQLAAVRQGRPLRTPELFCTVAMVLQLLIAAAEAGNGMTPAEQKIDSQLLQAARNPSSSATPSNAPRSAIQIGSDGTTMVDIKATVTDALLGQIRALGGQIISSFPQYHAIRASVPISRLIELAELPDVSFIRPAEIPALNK
jgi:hypothetical protein